MSQEENMIEVQNTESTELQIVKRLWSNFRFLCEKNEVSEYAVEKKFDLGKGYFNKARKALEKNGGRPRIDVVYAIAEYFDVTIDMLLKYDLSEYDYLYHKRFKALEKVVTESLVQKLTWERTTRAELLKTFRFNTEVKEEPDDYIEVKDFDNLGYPMIVRDPKIENLLDPEELELFQNAELTEDQISAADVSCREVDTGVPYYYSFGEQKKVFFENGNGFDVRDWYKSTSAAGTIYVSSVIGKDGKELIEVYLGTFSQPVLIGSNQSKREPVRMLVDKLVTFLRDNARQSERLSCDEEYAIDSFLQN